MAYKPNPSLLAFLFVSCAVLAASGARGPAVERPEWLIDPNDGSMLIPGIGRIMLPPLTGHKPGPGGGPYGGPVGFVPGGDDTFVPNPGVEVPGPSVPVTGP